VGLAGWLRVTVGTAAEIAAFLAALDDSGVSPGR
jgi:histidinol-phosphate/aromatic aminotransferase/cobyric acid decarboxylase-like protein